MKKTYPRVHGTPGIDLLDYFAAQAMPAVIAATVALGEKQINPFQVGMLSYAIAFGMLAAKEQPEEAFQPEEAKVEPPAEPEQPSLIVP